MSLLLFLLSRKQIGDKRAPMLFCWKYMQNLKVNSQKCPPQHKRYLFSYGVRKAKNSAYFAPFVACVPVLVTCCSGYTDMYHDTAGGGERRFRKKKVEKTNNNSERSFTECKRTNTYTKEKYTQRYFRPFLFFFFCVYP